MNTFLEIVISSSNHLFLKGIVKIVGCNAAPFPIELYLFSHECQWIVNTKNYIVICACRFKNTFSCINDPLIRNINWFDKNPGGINPASRK